MKLQTLIGVLIVAIALTGAANAHITLESQEARVGASYKGVLKVPHGCEKTATVSIRVKLPDGVIGVKQMPKP